MAWYHIPGKEQDVAVCTRVRLSRNLEGVPYPARMDPARARELIGTVGGILEKNGFTRQDFSELSRAATYALAEKQYISASALRESLPHALYLNEPCNLAVTVCAEEHIRLQAIQPGLNLRDALSGIMEVEAILDAELPFAFDERLGYLTRCPADLGTGMRAAVLLCLPVLETTGRCGELSETLERTGHRLRRCGGGGLYMLAHRNAPGVSETETVRLLEVTARHIIDAERRARDLPEGEEREVLVDRVLRADAVLRSARRLGEEEQTAMLSDLRLGAAMGVLDDVKVESVTVALIETQPAGLSAESEVASDFELELRRAAQTRERVFGGHDAPIHI